MTDAERWRRIAKALEDDTSEYGFLCNAVKWGAQEDAGARTRMQGALQLFEPLPTDKTGTILPCWWPSYDDARILAACLLAAMANADGGDHAAD